ncbi:hypothetical protein A2U01_0070542, partial [Trifolium medium]|nr:hypothetical protein [Trifolium medium]
MATLNNNGSEPDPNPIAAETPEPVPENLSNNNGSELDPNHVAAKT